MGHQNAKKLIYPETLYKTKSPKKIWQHDTLGENLRGGVVMVVVVGEGVCVTYPPTTTPPITLKLKCHNIIDIT